MKSKRKIRRGGLAPDKYLTEEQVERLLTWLGYAAKSGSNRSIVNRFIIIMLLYTGLRAEELLSLRIKDTPAYHGKPIIDVQEGKGCIARAVDIPDWLVPVIKDFIHQYRFGAKPGSVLIASEKGFRTLWLNKVMMENGQRTVTKKQERSARMIYTCLRERLERIGENSGIGRLRPHMLRHTYATLLYSRKQDLLCVQDALGHSDPKTTAIYARTLNDNRRKQVNSLPVWPSLSIKTQELQSRHRDRKTARC